MVTSLESLLVLVDDTKSTNVQVPCSCFNIFSKIKAAFLFVSEDGKFKLMDSMTE